MKFTDYFLTFIVFIVFTAIAWLCVTGKIQL